MFVVTLFINKDLVRCQSEYSMSYQMNTYVPPPPRAPIMLTIASRMISIF